MDVPEQHKLTTTTWCDKVASVFHKRKTSVVNNNHQKAFKTGNKSIMQCAVDYVESRELDKETLHPTNHMRLHKQMYLPCELIRMVGNYKTKAFREVLDRISFN